MDRENIILNNIKSIADAIAKHNGDNCEVCVHDLKAEDVDHTIIYIVNNHVTGRKVGDSFSFNYLKSRKLLEEGKDLTNRLVFHNQTLDGKNLKCSTLYLKDSKDEYRYMLCINQDVSSIIQANRVLDQLSKTYDENEQVKEEKLSINVNEILNQLIDNAVSYVGKTPAHMTTKDKKLAVKYLNDAGAFLISKSGDKISEYFGISKFTIYSYINSEKDAKENDSDNNEE